MATIGVHILWKMIPRVVVITIFSSRVGPGVVEGVLAVIIQLLGLKKKVMKSYNLVAFQKKMFQRPQYRSC